MHDDHPHQFGIYIVLFITLCLYAIAHSTGISS